jgi:hypothetical protein
MSGANKERSTQVVRSDDADADDSLHLREKDPEHDEMSHVSIAALAVGVVVIAGLVLVYASRHVHRHPGAVLVVLLGVPVLLLLAIVLGKRRRAHAG